MAASEKSIHLDFDSAWNAAEIPLRTMDFRDLGPKLRYFASNRSLERLMRQLPKSLPPFLLYGSGDFHHLSVVWLRRAAAAIAPGAELTVVSFDNHPDWDIRPPRFSCGGWVNRALETRAVHQVHVWGCGNFEPAFPSRLFANRRALRDGRLVVHPWAERQSAEVQGHFDCMTRQGWRYAFEQFSAGLMRKDVYITIDLDCLTADQAATNWENGLFGAQDICWAINQIRTRANIVAGDLCGAYSPPRCRGLFRKLAVWWDHPKLAATTLDQARLKNAMALKTIWPVLTE